MSKNCSICQYPIQMESDEEYILGNFGIIPVLFCRDCYVSMEDMVHKICPCPHCERYADEEDAEESMGE